MLIGGLEVLPSSQHLNISTSIAFGTGFEQKIKTRRNNHLLSGQ